MHSCYWSTKDHVIIPVVGASLSRAKTRKLTTNMADKRLETKWHFEEFLRHSISYKFAAARKRKTVENTFVKWVDRKPFPKIFLAKVVPDDHE